MKCVSTRARATRDKKQGRQLLQGSTRHSAHRLRQRTALGNVRRARGDSPAGATAETLMGSETNCSSANADEMHRRATK